eukprot:gb/GEZJ01005374.1/.p1 GENE.gb/GEZJ01005374.1/~~gb/GEZJ01005374.1/.p1  ORF type:complete len:114 (+),score=0.03 gb/GEZJ01005374.1/:380-721(+)
MDTCFTISLVRGRATKASKSVKKHRRMFFCFLVFRDENNARFLRYQNGCRSLRDHSTFSSECLRGLESSLVPLSWAFKIGRSKFVILMYLVSAVLASVDDSYHERLFTGLCTT